MQLPYPSAHPFPLILAPMAGVSEAPFRQICRRMGADLVLSEFLVLGGDSAPHPEHAGRVRSSRRCERPIGIQIYGADPERHGGGGGAHDRALPARVHRHQLRLSRSRKWSSATAGSGCLRDMDLVDADHPGRHWRDPSAGHGEDPERLERREPRSGDHRAPDAGRRRPGVHPACPHPHPDVLRQGRLGRDRAGGRGAGYSGHRQRRYRDRPPTSCACASTPGAPVS